jgi:hypothetical protein
VKFVKLSKFTVNLDLVAGFYTYPEMEGEINPLERLTMPFIRAVFTLLGKQKLVTPTGRTVVALRLLGDLGLVRLSPDDSDFFLRVLSENRDSLYLEGSKGPQYVDVLE